MPSLHSTIGRLNSITWEYLHNAVQDLGGEYSLDRFEVTVDHAGMDIVVVRIWFNCEEVWSRSISVSGLYDEFRMDDKELRQVISETMKAHLDLAAQLHFARLSQKFPSAITNVSMAYDATTNTKMIQVLFKNGHKAIGPESEAKSEVFLARCAMLYDLPPI